MKLKLGEDIYDICITKKISNKNTYLRVKDDLKIYITTNTFTSNKEIENIILKNQDAIKKMITKVTNEKNKQMGFFYLGKKYDIVQTSNSGIALGQEKFFVNKIAPGNVAESSMQFSIQSPKCPFRCSNLLKDEKACAISKSP